jgi:hypothetical protein
MPGAVHHPDVDVSTISKYFNGPVDNNTLSASPLYYHILNDASVSHNVGGTNIQPQAHLYQVQSMRRWGGRDHGSFPDPVNFRSPTHYWCGYLVQYFTSEWDRLANQSGDTQRFDREKTVLKAVKDNVYPFMETQVWANNGTAAPAGYVGLPGWLKNSSTYGTVTQSSNASWTPTILDGTTGISGKTFSTAPLDYFRRTVNNHAQKGQSESAKIPGKLKKAFTTQAIFEFLLNWHTGQSHTPVTVKTDEVGNNFATILESGVEVYWSPQATSAQIAFINTSNIKMKFQTGKNLEVRMSEPLQVIGQCVQIYTKTCMYNENPYQDALLSNTGVT